MLAAALLWATTLVSAPNDFRLNATRADGSGILFTGVSPDAQAWERFTTELAYVLAPRLVGPAETLGYGGFQVATYWSGTVVSASDGTWDVTERARGSEGEASGVMQTLTLDVKKGLPFSFELGASFAWLAESNLFAPGLELRWTLQEGHSLAPDFGVRAGVTHLVGSRDLNLTTVGIDAIVSKGFGVGGVMHVAPYLSWSVMMVAASSRVIDPTPTVEADFGDNFVFPELTAGGNVHHRLTLGVRALFYVLTLGVQGDFEMLESTPEGTDFLGSVATVSVKLGLEY
jgi:hypothetical protein